MSHLQLVALVVKEYQPAIAFFVNVLQFELIEDVASLTNDGRPKRWVVVRPPGAATGILLARADGEHQAEAVGRQFAGRVGLFLRVDDFEATFNRMVGAGVVFVSAPRVEPYGSVAVFLDLEGNRWDLLGRAAGPQPIVLVVTGASGAGKTTLVRGLEGRALPGVSCHYFDSIGVPSAEVMERDFGGGAGWQEATTRTWIGRLASRPDRVAVLDGQTRPSFVRTAFQQVGLRHGAIVLIECAATERNPRLQGARGQPELATAQMETWAAYLRGQADALGLPIIDTTRLTAEAALEELVGLVEALGRRQA
jgi:catechol 2,3-dioxygenase-like lactoylglutathione lyase family enzyme